MCAEFVRRAPHALGDAAASMAVREICDGPLGVPVFRLDGDVLERMG